MVLLATGISGADRTTTVSAKRRMRLSNGAKPRISDGVCRFRGAAASTPVIWEDKIFLTSAEGNALVLMCISTEGEERWKRTLGHGNRVVRGGEGNSAAPSPVTDGEHVWAFLGTGDLACYDFDGNQVWPHQSR